jgi:prepilin-type N-terminal cleavage/methylation domain-containing protein
MNGWWSNRPTRRRLNLRRRSFSLLELMVVIAIIALTTPLMGVGIYRALKKEQFEAASRELAIQLGQAQQTMLYADRDMLVELIPGPDGVLCQLIRPSIAGMGTPVGEPRLLKGVEQLLWNGQRLSGSLLLPFYSGGREMPRGEIAVMRDKEVRTVRLLGYPHPIQVENGENQQNQNHGESGYEAYPQEVVAALSPR